MNLWIVEGELVVLFNDGGCDEVCEGLILFYWGGKIFFIYLFCDIGKFDYQIWFIFFEVGLDLLLLSSWEQILGLLFSCNDVVGVWGLGYYFFFKFFDG